MFKVDELFNAESTDIKELKPGDKYYSAIVIFEADSNEIRVWQGSPKAKVVDEFTKNGVDYVIVMFDAPGNPPSNNTRYLYRAPQRK